MASQEQPGDRPAPPGRSVLRSLEQDLEEFGPRGVETVLLVEDEVLVRWAMGQLLRARGYRVLEAGSAEEAMDVADRHSGPIHMLLTDVVMPGLDGLRLTRTMQLLLPGLRALLMTGFADEVQRRGRELPAELLIKPFSARELAEAVRRTLDA